MLEVGDIVRFNSSVPNINLRGVYMIITHIPEYPREKYNIRFSFGSDLEHINGITRKEWIDKI